MRKNKGSNDEQRTESRFPGKVIHLWEIHLVNLQRVLADEDPMTPEEILPKDQFSGYSRVYGWRKVKEDSLLRAQTEQREQEYQERTSRAGIFRLKDFISFHRSKELLLEFSPADNHYAIDIVAPENSVIYAVLDGTVSFASWTEEFGYVLQIQHENNLLSIYKHCSQLFKTTGDPVTGICCRCNMGKGRNLSTGFHLHFELWHKGILLIRQITSIFNMDLLKRIAILGSTGSIGRQALDVIRRYPGLLKHKS